MEGIVLLLSISVGLGSTDFDTLLLGGFTKDSSYSTSLEVVTSDTTCNPDMPELPVGRNGAFVTLYGSKIFYCGGYNDETPTSFHQTCHSYLLGDSNTWIEEPSMQVARRFAGMSVFGETIYVSGGTKVLVKVEL